MNSINTQSNVNFTARMDIKGVKTGAKRLQNIVQMFETKTKKYPNDTFQIIEWEKDGIEISQFDKGKDKEHYISISEEKWNKFLEKSDEKILKSLLKLFNIFKKEDNIIDKGTELTNLMGESRYTNGFESKFWDLLVFKTKTDTEAAIAKDSTLKKFFTFHY